MFHEAKNYQMENNMQLQQKVLWDTLVQGIKENVQI